MTVAYQIPLPLEAAETSVSPVDLSTDYCERLITLLSQNLDFHDLGSGYASHNFHSFPAKFPPQLPRQFIEGLTDPGDVVLDPMAGSGTTVLEAYLAGRCSIGFDIDPLALLLSRVKVTPLDLELVATIGNKTIKQAQQTLVQERKKLKEALQDHWGAKTRQFVNYWFAPETQLELLALMIQIEKVEDITIRDFLKLIFSAIIITKSGGVSLAFDLAHTRPHRAKVVYSQSGEIVLGHNLVNSESSRVKFLTKSLRSPIEEFEKRLKQNLGGLHSIHQGPIQPQVMFGDAQNLPLNSASIDLIVTSPPYAAMAIDYMRAHKFSLVWMEHPIDELGQKRKEYIGGEAVTGIDYESLPDETMKVINGITSVDDKKGRILHRYYSEMTRTLRELYRVLKPGKAAIVVVGSSTMRGKDTRTATCLADIGQSIGFEVPEIGVRHLDRNRRMMPVGNKINSDSQIQQRMHKEYIIGFYKSERK